MCWFPPGCVHVVVDLFNMVYCPLVLFLCMVMCWLPPGCVRVVVDLFNTEHYLFVLLLLYSTYSNVFVPHPDVSAWWRTYLTRCIAHWYCFYICFPQCVRVVVDLFNMVHYLLVLLLLYSTYSNVFVSHPDVSAWWRTYLTRCITHWYSFATCNTITVPVLSYGTTRYVLS